MVNRKKIWKIGYASFMTRLSIDITVTVVKRLIQIICIELEKIIGYMVEVDDSMLVLDIHLY